MLKKTASLLLALAVTFTLIPASHAAGESSSTLKIPAGTVGIIARADEEPRIPQSFCVNGEYTYILDTQNSRVLKYKNNKLSNKIPISAKRSLIDIFVEKNKIYLLDENYTAYVANEKGKIQKKVTIPRIRANSRTSNQNGMSVTAYYDPKSIRYSNGSIVIGFANQKEFRLVGSSLRLITPYDTKLTLGKTSTIVRDSKYAKTAALKTRNSVVEASVRQRSGKKIYALCREIISSGAGFINDDAVHVLSGGKTIGYATLKQNSWSMPNRDVFITETGKIYQMIVSKTNITVIRLPLTQKRPNAPKAAPLATNIRLPGFAAASSAYQTLDKLEICMRMMYMTNNIYWNYNSTINADTSRVGVSKYVSQPDWLMPYEPGRTYRVKGIPYCWGGFDGLDTTSNRYSWTNFLDGVNKGYYAGNMHTSRTSHGYISGTVGLDCSGFVSSVFKFPSKKGTYGLVGSSYAFSSIPRDQVQFMDIFNQAGYHVMIVFSANKNEAGKVVDYTTFESTSKGDDKVQARIRPLSELTGYSGARYKYWGPGMKGRK